MTQQVSLYRQRRGADPAPGTTGHPPGKRRRNRGQGNRNQHPANMRRDRHHKGREPDMSPRTSYTEATYFAAGAALERHRRRVELLEARYAADNPYGPLFFNPTDGDDWDYWLWDVYEASDLTTAPGDDERHSD